MLALAYLRPEEGQSIWLKCRQGFQPCFEAGIRELPFLIYYVVEFQDSYIAAVFTVLLATLIHLLGNVTVAVLSIDSASTLETDS